MWTNRHDTECRVVSGPGRWHRCAHCGTRWRALGRFVRRTTRGYRCPGCAMKAERRWYTERDDAGVEPYAVPYHTTRDRGRGGMAQISLLQPELSLGGPDGAAV